MTRLRQFINRVVQFALPALDIYQRALYQLNGLI